MLSEARFKKIIWGYYRAHGRTLPWRAVRDPYRILVSEIMLQQTQVSRVVGFYKNFIKKFPNFQSLAKAKTSEVLLAWQGLGYNRRALALRRLAQEVVEYYGGKLPRDAKTLESLPGIGPYTAGAIRAFAFNEPDVFVETNIRRVFIHFFFSERGGVTDTAIKRCIQRTLDRKNPREWYFALMDYGAMLGGSGSVKNPNRRSAHYIRQSEFAGSDRELRGKIIRSLLKEKKIGMAALSKQTNEPLPRVRKIVASLQKESFLTVRNSQIQLAK